MLMNEKTCVFPILLQRIRYLKLFETAKIHVQIIRFTYCLNMALILSKPKLGHDLFGITLHVQECVLALTVHFVDVFARVNVSRVFDVVAT